MEKDSLGRLCAAIATYAKEHDSYLTKTKLLKLLYLFDVEFYRVHRKTFTGFSWKFFHLGPWAVEFDQELSGLIAGDVLRERFGNYDTPFIDVSERLGVDSVFSSFRNESILRSVLKTWGASATNEILDYAYFKTEPMENAVRNEALDFAVIPPEVPPLYKRTTSRVTPKDFIEARKRLSAMRESAIRPPAVIAPPRYDEAFALAISTMDADEDY